MPKYAPEAFQNQARPAPKPSKIEARGIPGRKNAFKKRPKPAKKRPRAPNNHPRSVQERPRAGPELPKGGEVASKSDPREVRSPPYPARRAPRRGWSRIFVGSFVRHAPEVILYRFSACATSSRYVKTRENLGKIVVFTHQELCRSQCSQSRRNFRK